MALENASRRIFVLFDDIYKSKTEVRDNYYKERGLYVILKPSINGKIVSRMKIIDFI